MSNAVYPHALDSFGTGKIDWTTDTIMVQLLGAGYTYSATDTNPTQLADTIGAAQLVGDNKFVDRGEFHADAVTLPTVAAGSTVKAMVIYQDTGVAADSILISYMDTRSDSGPINFATDGSDVIVTWAGNILFKI